MPRSLGGIISVTYDKLLTFILPKLIKSWESYGYKQDLHFWVRKFAPKELRREKPYLPVSDAKHFIHWWNGSGQQLISLDRLGVSNAGDLDYLYFDEAKLLNDVEKWNEVVNANRGNNEHFGHLSQHHSILITTDMPKDERASWIFMYDDLQDPEIIEGIIQLQQHVTILKQNLQEAETVAEEEILIETIQTFEEGLNELRKGAVYVSEASTLDNVHTLGLETLLNFYRNLSETVYRRSILNQRVKAVENGFYGKYDEYVHGYRKSNMKFMDTIEVTSSTERDCRWDKDLLEAPLAMGWDHNASCSWVITGQKDKERLLGKQQSALSVERPKRTRHLAEKWCKYYEHHPVKEVFFFHDHTSISEDASRESFAEEIEGILRSHGWTVHMRYMGHTWKPKDRYEFWGEFMDGDREDGYKWVVNLDNNDECLTALEQTRVMEGKDGFEKDKRPEKNSKFPQLEAPHATDAMDTLWVGLMEWETTFESEFFDTLTG